MRTTLARAALASAAVFALVVLSLAWHRGGAPPVAALQGLRVPGCEEEVDSTRGREYAGILVSAPLLNNRLVHDCQKLITSNGQYGPLTALQPAEFDSLKWHDTGLLGPRGRHVYEAVLADIIDYDTSLRYDPLNISAGLNCLWVRGDPRAPAQWVVAVRKGRTCTDMSRLDRVMTTLQVRLKPYKLPASPAYAPRPRQSTARWEWDRVSRTQFIGIHCGKYWCEFGQPGFTGSQDPYGDDIGLRDEQFLSERDAQGSPTSPTVAAPLHPSPVWGRIEPTPMMAAPDPHTFANPQHVANLTLMLRPLPGFSPARQAYALDVLAQYGRRFGLQQQRSGALGTDIWMKFFSEQDYRIATRSAPQNWTHTERCRHRHAVVGAVRWRWASTDENIWLACTNGCCTAPGID